MFNFLIKNKSLIGKIIFFVSFFLFLKYILYYISNYEYQNNFNIAKNEINLKCLKSVCVKYDSIKECINFTEPLLFEIKDIKNVLFTENLNVFNLEITNLKKKCNHN